MRKNIVGVAVVTLVGLLATAALAFCQPGKCALKDGQVAGASAGCISQCIHPCDAANCDHRCTPGEHGKTFARTVADKAINAADKPCCAKGKGGCDKPCCAKGKATLTADKADGKKPCHAKGKAALTTDKAKGKGGCNKPCHAKGKATLTANKTDGKKPCHAKGRATLTADKAEGKGGCGKSHKGKDKATLTADKGDGKKPCHAKGKATLTADKAEGKGKGGCNKPCHAKGKATLTADKGDEKKPCYAKGKATLTADKTDAGSKPCPLTGKPLPAGAYCPIDVILASMPSMRYRVGKDETCCAKSAKNLAAKAGAPVQYLVGDTVFPDKQVATVELTKQLATEADKLRSMQFVADGKSHFCPMSAKDLARKTKTSITYRVGGFDFTDKPEAEKVIKLVADATEKVQMTYKVGENVFHCGKTAKSKADGNGHKLTYVVGKDETCCEISAGLSLAWAKIRAIVEAAATSSTL